MFKYTVHGVSIGVLASFCGCAQLPAHDEQKGLAAWLDTSTWGDGVIEVTMRHFGELAPLNGVGGCAHSVTLTQTIAESDETKTYTYDGYLGSDRSVRFDDLSTATNVTYEITTTSGFQQAVVLADNHNEVVINAPPTNTCAYHACQTHNATREEADHINCAQFRVPTANRVSLGIAEPPRSLVGPVHYNFGPDHRVDPNCSIRLNSISDTELQMTVACTFPSGHAAGYERDSPASIELSGRINEVRAEGNAGEATITYEGPLEANVKAEDGSNLVPSNEIFDAIVDYEIRGSTKRIDFTSGFNRTGYRYNLVGEASQ